MTGAGVRRLNEAVSEEMVTVFIPSSPTAFSGYVVVAPRDAVIELPLTVEEAMRLLVSGGVIAPEAAGKMGGEHPAPAAAVAPHPQPDALPGHAAAHLANP